MKFKRMGVLLFATCVMGCGAGDSPSPVLAENAPSPEPAIDVPASLDAMDLDDKTPVTEKDLDVAFYPGSEPMGPGARIDSLDLLQITAQRSTKDAPDSVAQYYATRVKKAEVVKTPNMGLVTGQTPSGYSVTVTATREAPEEPTVIGIVTTRKKR